MDRVVKPWTDEDVEVLLRLNRAGLTMKAVAHRLGRPTGSIKGKALPMGLSFRNRGQCLAGERAPSGPHARVVTTEAGLREPWAMMKDRREAERSIVRAKAIALGIQTALRPWADVVRDVEHAA